MAVLYDARGNEIRVGPPDGVTGEVITDARPITATLGALNAESLLDLNGAANCMIDLRTAAGALTVVFEATIDGTNYFALPAIILNQTLGAAVAVPEAHVPSVVIATTASGQYSLGVTGIRRVRIRVSAYTSGNVVVAMRSTQADYAIFNKPLPALLAVTVTAAANTGITITMPAPGVGLFHYICALFVNRNATAALAGTATLVITSTNLPGNPAWSVGNAMVAGGSAVDIDLQPFTPVKSLVANTATTVVAPVPGAAVLWRGNVFYYVGA